MTPQRNNQQNPNGIKLCGTKNMVSSKYSLQGKRENEPAGNNKKSLSHTDQSAM